MQVHNYGFGASAGADAAGFVAAGLAAGFASGFSIRPAAGAEEAAGGGVRLTGTTSMMILALGR